MSRTVPTKRILSLRDPTAKMSKSAPLASSRVVLTDPPSTIQKSIKSAVTDSIPGITYDPMSRPGLSNLLLIWSSLDASARDPETLAEAAQREGWGMGKLKEVISEVVVERLEPIRKEFQRIREDKGWLREVALAGRTQARAEAANTMDEIRRTIGLDPI